MPLNDTRVRNAKVGPKPYKLTDSHGLYLEVRPSGAKLWRYRYRIAGKENVFALGEYASAPAGESAAAAGTRKSGRRFTVAEAREERLAARSLVKFGVHPAHDRHARRAERTLASTNTFEVVGREWLAKQKAG